MEKITQDDGGGVVGLKMTSASITFFHNFLNFLGKKSYFNFSPYQKLSKTIYIHSFASNLKFGTKSKVKDYLSIRKSQNYCFVKFRQNSEFELDNKN